MSAAARPEKFAWVAQVTKPTPQSAGNRSTSSTSAIATLSNLAAAGERTANAASDPMRQPTQFAAVLPEETHQPQTEEREPAVATVAGDLQCHPTSEI